MPHTFSQPDKPLARMSADELADLKRRWYSEARDSGTLARIEEVCRRLGDSLSVRYGPKYELHIEDVYLYLDGYGRFMTFAVGGEAGRRVCSTHPCEELFVPSRWLGKVEAYHPEASYVREEDENARERERRAKLLEQLGGEPGCDAGGP